jgi:hypothetical protein
MSFANLKKSRGTGALAQKVKDAQTKGTRESEFYYPQIDKEKGTANVVIRFLPPKDDDCPPYVTHYGHGFKGDDGKWVIVDLCPTACGQECPICARNSELWNSGVEENKKVVSLRKRKKSFIANILVIKDPKNPENEGKVFPFKFGSSIMGKVMGAIEPKFEGDESIDPFDMWDGANFNLRIARDPAKQNQVTYEASSFEGKSELFPGNDKQKE